MNNLLEMHDVYANIGQFEILQGINVQVPAGKVTVLLGRNGAGKTTTLRTIMGYVGVLSGDIQFSGQSVATLPTYKIQRRGISYLPEEGHVFANLSIEDNLRLADRKRDRLHAARLDRVFKLFPDLKLAAKRPAGTLSGGQKQMLAMASVLMADQPLVLIDEPSKGLSPAMVDRLIDILIMMKESTTILLVEQNLYLAKRVADWFHIIDNGCTVLQGTMTDLMANTLWQQQYLGVHVGPTKEGAS